MSSSMYKIFIFYVLFLHIIQGLDECEDKTTDCQPCNLQYPVPSPTRENCMETCQVCTNDKNVALNQTTRQSLTGYLGESGRAVDGNTSGDYLHNSCTHTEGVFGTHWWCVDLKKIYNIKNLTMYNRDGSTSYRLQGFELKTSSSGQCNEAGFTTSSLCYKNDPPTNQRVYTIDRCNQDSNKSIVAGTLFVSVTGLPLTICEIQIFTGTSCSYGYYSTSSSTCEPCDDGCSDNKCNPDTGDCIGVCTSGFYGTKCNKACSQGCSTPDCKRDGSCTVCKPGWYGDNCESRCPTGCKETCNKTSGTCDGCKDGTVGLYCNMTCGADCPIVCEQQECNINCTRTCDGSSCKEDIEKCSYLCSNERPIYVCTKEPDDNLTTIAVSVTIAVLLVIAVILVAVFIIRRRQPGDQQDTRTDQRRRNNSISTNQPSTIIQNETFLSDQQTYTYDTLVNRAAHNDAYSNAYSSLSNK